jgi:hypothetical protein
LALDEASGTCGADDALLPASLNVIRARTLQRVRRRGPRSGIVLGWPMGPREAPGRWLGAVLWAERPASGRGFSGRWDACYGCTASRRASARCECSTT